MKRKIGKYIILSIFLLVIVHGGQIYAQSPMPDVLKNGTLQEQKDYLEEKMNSYNGYRAVRDDIFLQMLKNSLDSLNSAKHDIKMLHESAEDLQSNIESLNIQLTNAKKSEEKAITEKNSLLFFRIPMNKITYNFILWGIIASLAFLLTSLFLLYKRNFSITSATKKDLEDTREEFDIFRRTSREKQEQLVINHFNEIKKLKGGA